MSSITDRINDDMREKMEMQTLFPTLGPVHSPMNRVDTVTVPPETAQKIKEQLKGSALKFDQDKLPLHLLSTEAMNQTAAVLKFGAQKYAEHNWRQGFTWSRPLSAALRHLTAFNAGEDKDPESGLSHLAHAACCIMFLLEFEKTHPELDDRWKPTK